MAQLATISGSIAGDENHHCVKLEKKKAAEPNATVSGFRMPMRRNIQPVASSRPKIFAHQYHAKPRSRSSRKNPQSCGRKNVV
jgi:hypothetical protein